MINSFWRSTWKAANSWHGPLLTGLSIGFIVPLVMNKTEEWYCNEIKGVLTIHQEIRVRSVESPEDMLRSDEFQVEIDKINEEFKSFDVELEHLSEIREFIRKCRYYPGQETRMDIERIDRLVKKTHDIVAERERIEKMYTLARELCRFHAPVDKHKKIRDLLKDTEEFIAARKHAEENNKFIEKCRRPNKSHIKQVNNIIEGTKGLLIERDRIERLINKMEGFSVPHSPAIR